MAIRVTGMTINIQHRKTKLFFHASNGWVTTRDLATDFATPLTALNFATEHVLDDTEIVFFVEPVLAHSVATDSPYQARL
jgi:hypothetical protein